MPRHLVWVGAFALALGLLAVALPAPPAAAQGPDQAQVAKIVEIVKGLGYPEPEERGLAAPSRLEVELPACLDYQVSLQVIGVTLAIIDSSPSEPGKVSSNVSVDIVGPEATACGQAMAKYAYDYVAGEKPVVTGDSPEILNVAGSPAAVAIEGIRSKVLHTIGGAGPFQQGAAKGALNCGNVAVSVRQSRIATSPGTDLAGRDQLARDAKADVKQRLTALGQALANANACSGSWQASASQSPGAGQFAVVLGCAYNEEPAAPGMARCTADTSSEPSGADLADIVFKWSFDGVEDASTNQKTYSRPDGEITPGQHTITVHAVDNRTTTSSKSESWTFTKPGGGGAGASGSASGGPESAAPGSPAAPGFALTVGCTKQDEKTGVVDSEVTVVCEAKPSGQPVGASPSYTWSWDGLPVPGATGSILTSKSIPPGDTATHVVTVKATVEASGATSPVASTSVARSSSPLSFIPPEIWAGVNNALTGTPDPTPPDPSEDSGATIVVAVILGTAAAAAAALGGKAADSPLASGLATAAGGVADAVTGITAPAPAVKPAAEAPPGPQTAAAAVAGGAAGHGASPSVQGNTPAMEPVSGTSAAEASGVGDAMGILDGTFGEGLQAAGGAGGAPPAGGSPSGPPAGPRGGDAAPGPATVGDGRLVEDLHQAQKLDREILTGAVLTGDPFSVIGGELPDAESPEAAAAAAATQPAREAVEDLAAINVGTPSDHLEHVEPGIQLEADVEHKRLEMDRLHQQLKDAAARKQQLEKDGQAGTDAYRAAVKQGEATVRRWSDAVDDHAQAQQRLDQYRKDHPGSGSPGAGAGSGKPGGPGR